MVNPQPQPASVPVELMAYAASYTDVEPEEEEPAGRRRFSVAPAWMSVGGVNYLPYEELQGSGTMPNSNVSAAIGVYFTKDSPLTEEMHKIRKGSDGKWRIDENPSSGGDHYLYGYVPSDAAESSILPNDTYADGVKLTLTGLSTVSDKDVCVIVGAKDGTDENTVPGLKTGQFTTYFRTGEDESNFLFLLFDHIYSALSFHFTLDSDYGRLRTIKLKQLELIAYSDKFITKMAKKQTTTITLEAKDNESPIVGDITFTPVNPADKMEYVTIFHDESNPVELPTSGYTEVIGFVPKGSNYYKMRSTYDVYDKAGNMTRSGCTAENMINFDEIFQTEFLRGHRYIIKLKVKPTYLYVLSDPDLENPTLEVN